MNLTCTTIFVLKRPTHVPILTHSPVYPFSGKWYAGAIVTLDFIILPMRLRRAGLLGLSPIAAAKAIGNSIPHHVIPLKPSIPTMFQDVGENGEDLTSMERQGEKTERLEPNRSSRRRDEQENHHHHRHDNNKNISLKSLQPVSSERRAMDQRVSSLSTAPITRFSWDGTDSNMASTTVTASSSSIMPAIEDAAGWLFPVVRVRFDGFSSYWDERYDAVAALSTLRPLRTHTVAPWVNTITQVPFLCGSWQRL